MSGSCSEKAGIVIRLEEDGPTTRIAVEIPVSYFKALTAVKWKEDKTQSEIIIEALRLFFSKEIRPIEVKSERSLGDGDE